MATKRTKLHTPIGIAAYCWLIKPRPAKVDKDGKPRGEPKYGMALFFKESTDMSELEDAAKACLVEKFGPKAMDAVKRGKLRWPIRSIDGTEEDDDGNPPEAPFDKPGYVVNFSGQDRPGIVDQDAEPIMEKSEIYSGMEARVSCRTYSYDVDGNKGASFGLINVQKTGDGERLSGNPSAEDDFKPAKKKPQAKKRVVDDDDIL